MQKLSVFILAAALLAVAIAVPLIDESKPRTKRVVDEEIVSLVLNATEPEFNRTVRESHHSVAARETIVLNAVGPESTFENKSERDVESNSSSHHDVHTRAAVFTRGFSSPVILPVNTVRRVVPIPMVQPFAMPMVQPVVVRTAQPIFAQPFVGSPMVGQPFVGRPFVGSPMVGTVRGGTPMVGSFRGGRSTNETTVETTTTIETTTTVETPLVNSTTSVEVSGESRVEREVARHRIIPALPETLNFDEKFRQFNVSSLCESSTGFKYYKEHPEDRTKYVQCNPWGAGEVRSCENGTIWNSWSLRCDFEENVRNVTLAWEAEFRNASIPVNCTQNELECINDGVCVTVFGRAKCQCSANFTGQFCESKVDNFDLYHEIVSGSFNASLYRQRLESEITPVKVSFYEQYESKLSKETYDELIGYLRLWENGTTNSSVRYDVLVNFLVEEVLQNIYPDAYYLMNFNASEQSVVELIRLIPNLLSYAKYSSERYSEVFVEYQSVLGRLSVILNETCEQTREYAARYTRLTNVFLNQTLSLTNESWFDWQQVNNATIDEPSRLTDSEVKEKLRSEFNATLERSNKLFESLNKFHDKVVSEMAVNKGIYNVTLGACDFVGSNEVITLFDGIARSTTEVWESLVNYGFWVITNYLSQSGSKTTANFRLPEERI